MKESEIVVGKIYVNRGAGKTLRRVIAIGPDHLPSQAWNADGKFPEDAVGVLYVQLGPGSHVSENRKIWSKSFASWAKGQVEE